MLYGLSGSAVATRYLDNYYYLQYLRAVRKGGMEAVCSLDRFAGLVATRPENRQLLLEMDPVRFTRTMLRWREAFLLASDQPVMGARDEDLRGIDVPTAIVPYYDRIHAPAAAAHAKRLIRDSHFVDFDPARRMVQSAHAAEDPDVVATVATLLRNFELRRSHRPRRSRLVRLCGTAVASVRWADGPLWTMIRGPVFAYRRRHDTRRPRP